MMGVRGRRAAWARVRRWVAGIAVAVLVLAAAGICYEQLSTARLFARYPGRLVAVGEQVLHLHCTGSGGPTIIIEAGAGSFSLDWQGVRRALEDEARVCAYDRPGLGWSPGATNGAYPDPVPRLRDLLEAAGERGPYLLVGHSLGGLFVQEFARSYPEQVAGVVLVDSVHPEQADRIPVGVRGTQERLYEQMRVYAALARFGVPRLAAKLGAVELPPMPSLTPVERQLRVDIALSPRHLAATALEAGEVEAMLLRARSETRPFPDAPLVVVSRGRAEHIPGLPETASAASERVWRAMQGELSRLSVHGEQWIAEESGHNIMLDQPGLIAAAIEQVAADWGATGEMHGSFRRSRAVPMQRRRARDTQQGPLPSWPGIESPHPREEAS